MTKQTLPPQHQDHRPGREEKMQPEPIYIHDAYKGSEKLAGKVAIITGADSGIGRAVAVHFAREGADISVVYREEHADAEVTRREIEACGRKVLLFSGDAYDKNFCNQVVEETRNKLSGLDILVNNAGEQHPKDNLEDIRQEQWEKTFQTNIFAMFQLTKLVLPHLSAGSAIINTSSITAYKGNPILLDYSASKGAVVSFTRSLAINVAERGIRVNAVAPGPIWTPLIPSTFDEDTVKTFGADTPLSRPGQPAELGPTYVYLACRDSSYVTGQVIHVNGGQVING